MLDFPRTVFIILLSGCLAGAFGQTETVLPPIDDSAPQSANPTAANDPSTTSDVVIKGFIPDLQRQKLMETPQAATTEATPAENLPAPATTPKPTENKEDKARLAKEAADRANGIDPNKTPKPMVAKATPKPTPVEQQAAATPTPEPTVVKQVPTKNGDAVSIKTKVTQASAPSSFPEGSTSFRGTIRSMQSGKGSTLRVMIDSDDYGAVEVVVQPRIGTRIPMEGTKVTVYGEKIGGSGDVIVVRADAITKQGDTLEPRRAVPVRRGPVIYPGGPGRRMPYGPPVPMYRPY